MSIQEIYEVMVGLGLTRSQVEFSRLWLGKSARYYSSMIVRQQQPSLGTLTGLQFRLRNTVDHVGDGGQRSAIFTLIQRIDRHVMLRVFAGGALRRLPTAVAAAK